MSLKNNINIEIHTVIFLPKANMRLNDRNLTSILVDSKLQKFMGSNDEVQKCQDLIIQIIFHILVFI